MNNQNLLRGVFLLAVALVFGIGSTRYQIGNFAHAGPGLFPLAVSCIVGFIGLVMIARSRMVPRVPMNMRAKNAVLVLLSLVGFGIVSQLLNMAAGIVFMVFLSGLAGSSFSWKRSLTVSVALVGIAYIFYKFLGLNLPLFNLPSF